MGGARMSTSRDFDWIEMPDDVVVPEQAAIAVYINRDGEVVIRQAGQYHPDEDSCIVVAPAHARRLADAIIETADIAAHQPDDGDPPAPKDRTAAKQRAGGSQ